LLGLQSTSWSHLSRLAWQENKVCMSQIMKANPCMTISKKQDSPTCISHPLHLGQRIFLDKDNFFDVPLYKSSSDTFKGWTTSSPLLCLRPPLPLPPAKGKRQPTSTQST
jgi:hypothetical protein